MYKEIIEIRYSKSRWFLYIGLVIFGFLLLIGYPFFYLKMKASPEYIGWATAALGGIIYLVYHPLKQMRTSKPVLTLSKDSLDICRGRKNITLHWREIINIGTEKEEGQTLLKITTKKNIEKIYLSTLDRKEAEVIELIRKYWK